MVNVGQPGQATPASKQLRLPHSVLREGSTKIKRASGPLDSDLLLLIFRLLYGGEILIKYAVNDFEV